MTATQNLVLEGREDAFTQVTLHQSIQTDETQIKFIFLYGLNSFRFLLIFKVLSRLNLINSFS